MPTSATGGGPYHLPGTLLPDGERRDLWTDGERLTGRPVDSAESLPGRFALPGLVDAHAHLALAPGDGPTAAVATVIASLKIDRDAGVLLVRDVGAPQSVNLRLRADAALPRLADTRAQLPAGADA